MIGDSLATGTMPVLGRRGSHWVLASFLPAIARLAAADASLPPASACGARLMLSERDPLRARLTLSERAPSPTLHMR